MDPHPAHRPASKPVARLAARYDRWQATARYPRMIHEHLRRPRARSDGADALQRFNPRHARARAGRMACGAGADSRGSSTSRTKRSAGTGRSVVRTMAPAIWDSIPALRDPDAAESCPDASSRGRTERPHRARRLSYIVVLLDRNYITGEMLPALAQQHFARTGDGFDYQLAVVESGRSRRRLPLGRRLHAADRTARPTPRWICSR